MPLRRIALLLLMIGSVGYGATSLVDSKFVNLGAVYSGTTATATLQVGDMIAAALVSDKPAAATLSISDNRNGSYTAVPAATIAGDAGHASFALFYIVNTYAGSVTITFTSSINTAHLFGSYAVFRGPTVITASSSSTSATVTLNPTAPNQGVFVMGIGAAGTPSSGLTSIGSGCGWTWGACRSAYSTTLSSGSQSLYVLSAAGAENVAAAFGLATDYSIAGPSSGYVTTASTNFTITNLTGNWGSTPKTITIADGGKAGTVTLVSCTATGAGTTPAALSLTGGTSCTFTYTPSAVGSLTLTSTINSGTDPSPNTRTYTSNPATLTFSGCSSGNLRVASATCTVTMSGLTFDGTHAITLSDGGNLGTFTSGTTGNPLTVTPGNGASSFTFTYTPYLVGAKPISGAANTANWSAPTAFTYTSASTDVCTFTAKASGNWASAGTWTPSGCTGGGHTTPDSGDSVVITGYHITVPASTMAYVGSCPANNTTYNVQLTDSGGASGWLEVAGRLWVCGNIQLTASTHTLGNNPTSWPIFQLDTGAELDLDQNQNASVAYRVTSANQYGWGKLISGVSTDTCTFSSGTCQTTIKGVNLAAGGVNPNLYEAAVQDALTYQIYGTLISDCGSAAKGCLEYYHTAGVTPGYTGAGTIDLRNNIFQRTGTFQAPTSGLTGAVPVPNFVGNRFLNDLLGVQHLDGPSTFSGSSCVYTGNYFSGAFESGNEGLTPCSFTGNVFAAGDSLVAAASFTGNLRVTPYSDGLGTVPIANNNYLVGNDNAASSMHMYLLSSITYHFNFTMAGNVGESIGAVQNEGHCGGDFSIVSGADAYIQKVFGNLAIISSNGQSSCTWSGLNTSGGAYPVAPLYFDHNGSNGTPGASGNFQGWLLYTGHGSSYYPTNTPVVSLKSNIGFAPSAGANQYMFGDLASSLNSIPTTLFNTSGVDYNNVWHGSASTLYGAGSACNGGTASTFNGTSYQICAATGGPGAHEQAVDPKYIDYTRNISKWGATHGQAASLAGALTAFQQCRDVSWCVAELLTYVRRGYQPTNLALKGKAHDGSIVGFTGSYGSGYTGACSVTITPVAPPSGDDLGHDASATCSFNGSGVPVIKITNSGANYRISSPATVTIGGTCTGSCVAANLTPIISPMDIGPVQMLALPHAE